MLGQNETNEIRQLIYAEMADMESQISHNAGTYNYLCWIQGGPVFTHNQVGPVLRTIFHSDTK